MTVAWIALVLAVLALLCFVALAAGVAFLFVKTKPVLVPMLSMMGFLPPSDG